MTVIKFKRVLTEIKYQDFNITENDLNMTQSDINMTQSEEETSTHSLTHELVYRPLFWICVILILLLLYFIYSWLKKGKKTSPPPEPAPPVKRRDMTYQELKEWDGRNENNTVFVAVNGRIFDVTKDEKFRPGFGRYEAFAGKDVTRCLAKFSMEGISDEYDDLSDLTTDQMEEVREWEAQFEENYTFIGRLLRPGEEPTDYSDDEDAVQDPQSIPSSSKKDE